MPRLKFTSRSLGILSMIGLIVLLEIKLKSTEHKMCVLSPGVIIMICDEKKKKKNPHAARNIFQETE